MKKSSWVAALLGVVFGFLCAFLWDVAFKDRKAGAESPQWQKLNLALNAIENAYVDTLNHPKLTDEAIEAVLKALDPHSVYMLPKELEQADGDLAGNFEGIGIQFNVPNDTAIVIETIAGGPSEKIGMLAGDRLLRVDGRNIAGVKCPQDSMVRLMRGLAGTKVLVEVKRGREEIPFEITRAKIPVNSVEAFFMVSDTVGYIRLSKFSRDTFVEFLSAAFKLNKQGMKKMILDLRDNTGGFMDQALLMANSFLPKGAELVYMEGLHYPKHVYYADGQGPFQDMAISILMNESSASSSEILAGAIQDNDRGVIYGRRSFGKGLVQEPINFSDGSGIRLTVARFHTPSGRCIQKPYERYNYDIYDRYAGGEMLEADSIKVDRSVEYYTKAGRVVYGGGGIVPDVFVPIDTTRATAFYSACSRKATALRFASAYFDAHKAELQAIGDYAELERYLAKVGLECRFLAFAKEKDGLSPLPGEWEKNSIYMLVQIKALVGRYSKLGENAFYHMYLQTDETFHCAMN
ncbi:MAG: S41 family peptidase [Bacteroidales bacterium]|nr:S41 family peptidase [Bacteroidales bacterium]